ncbi:SRPBCC domain-containing protein [Kibdelosporangium lantanae]|uniref:SRPBCC domain-containing protein n=1 Tax=Kibdelosporangium lantanae TaxID=1497396 RepID=A0ABW3MGV8_9PSEU
MPEQFEVHWEGDLAGTPAQVWDAFTVHTAGWYWKISYEPRVGGAETGLSQAGGEVTAWEPYTHFATRAESGEYYNQLDYRLTARPDGTTHLSFTHQGVFGDDDYDRLYDCCQQHTKLYYHSLVEYMRHFAGQDAEYVTVDASGSYSALMRTLGVPDDVAVGDNITLTPDGLKPVAGVVDYAVRPFLGVRTEDALYRFFGRDRWGMPVGVAMHLYAEPLWDEHDLAEVLARQQ